MKTTITHAGDPAETCHAFAKQLGWELKNLSGDVLILLPGGGSVLPLLVALIEMIAEFPKELRAKLFFGLLDERCVEPHHADRNAKMLREKFWVPMMSKGLIGGHQILDYGYQPWTADRGAKVYWEKLKEKLDSGATLIVVCGVGEDGHIASLFPGRAELETSEPGYVLVSDSPKPPAERITATPGLLARANISVLLFFGEGKRRAYEDFRGPALPTQCPAKLLPSPFVLTDLKI